MFLTLDLELWFSADMSSPLMDHKLIESRENVYYHGNNNGKHYLLNIYWVIGMVLSTFHIQRNESLQQPYEAGIITFIQIL